MKNIGILSNSVDTHVDEVEIFLKKKKINYFRFNSDSVNDKQYIQYTPQLTPSIVLNINNKIISPQDISAIWYRKPDQWWKWDLNDLSEGNRDILNFKVRETNTLIRQFINECNKLRIPIICNPLQSRELENKMEQLLLAKRIGLRIPETLITSNKKVIETFLNKYKYQAIVKSLLTHDFNSLKIDAFTYKIEPQIFKKQLKKDLDFDYPLFLQEMIKKKLELRITIFGEKIFPVAIDSQSNKICETDWRTINPYYIRHAEYKLPKDIEKKCRLLMKKMNLYYGAIDMAITPDDKYVFFEINPYGQYLWIEEITKLPLSKAMADLLIKLATEMSHRQFLKV